MFNARQLLDQLVQTTQGMMTPSSAPSAAQEQKIGGLLGHPALTGALSGVGGGLLAGLLLGNKSARKIGSNIAAYGGAAALGAIAISAYRNWQTGKNRSAEISEPSRASRQSPQLQRVALEFDALPAEEQEGHCRVILAAIIAAAKADGHFDERERQMINERTNQIGDVETAAWVQQEIRKPLDVAQVAALAASPETAAEIYLASLIVIDDQNAREKMYLDALAEKLRLEAPLRQEIELQLAQTGVQAASL